MTPIGIATTVDWAMMVPCVFGDPNMEGGPRTIYVHNYMLPHFIESTLHFMNSSYHFVLISGGTDLTIPRSIDKRYTTLRGFSASADGGPYFQTLVRDERLIHWFCENRDIEHPKLSTLPTGFTFPWTELKSDLDRRNHVPIDERPLKIFVSIYLYIYKYTSSVVCYVSIYSIEQTSFSAVTAHYDYIY